MDIPVKNSLSVGKMGEDLVKMYLVREGFTVLGSNIRVRGGEIDLIAQKKDLVICVEVKTRIDQKTDMAELITPWQQERIILTARYFLAQHNLTEVTCQFDVALIALYPMLSLDYIPNAFEGDD